MVPASNSFCQTAQGARDCGPSREFLFPKHGQNHPAYQAVRAVRIPASREEHLVRTFEGKVTGIR